jgi:hypothetical protein
VDVSQFCAGLPTFSLEGPAPSFAQDAELNAKFPAQIDGNPVTGVQSSYYLTGLCYFGNTDTIARFAQSFPGTNMSAMSTGSARATVGEDDISIQALRVPGGNAAQMVANVEAFLIAIGVPPENTTGLTKTSANLGGRNVTVITDEDGDTTYVYPSGDTIFSVSDCTQEQAGTIFAALP